MNDRPLKLGAIVKPYGKVAGMVSQQGERYYWLIDDDTGCVSFMPADTVETMACDLEALPIG